MKTTLCVIDVQPQFPAASSALPGVMHQIKLAKHRGSNILLFEYEGGRPSYECIYRSLKNYDKWHVIEKDMDDGGPALHEFLYSTRSHIYTDRFRVCGVNTCYCVYETLFGLRDFFPEAVVQLSESSVSCNCYSYSSGCKPIPKFVEIVV